MNKSQLAQQAIARGLFEETEGGILIPDLNLRVGGFFTHEIVRDGKSLGVMVDHNLVVNEGLNHLLDVVLGVAAKISSWYVGIFEGNYTPIAANASATFKATSTESVAYTEATRPLYVKGAVASQQVSNTANKATFTINASKTIYGAYLTSASAKDGSGDAAGKLFAASRFSVARTVVADDQLLVTYTVQAASA